MKEKEIHFLLSIVLFITILFLTSIFCVEDMQIKKVSFDWYIWVLIISMILLVLALIITLIVLKKNYTGETVYLSKEDLHYKSNFKSAKEIYIDKDVVNIPYKHFYKLKNLQCVVFEGENTAISPGAFEGCTSLERVYLPSKLTKIRKETFKNCKKLEEITIPDSVTKIGAGAFKDCKKLKCVTFEGKGTWKYTENSDYTGGTEETLNAEKLRKTHCNKYWYKETKPKGGEE